MAVLKHFKPLRGIQAGQHKMLSPRPDLQSEESAPCAKAYREPLYDRIRARRKIKSSRSPIPMRNRIQNATILTLAACLLLQASPAAFSSVQVFGVSKSRQHPQIATDVDGRPFPGASVEVYLGFGPQGEPPHAKPLLILSSDANGHVVLPQLPRGKYYILGRSKPNREDHLYLEISSFAPTTRTDLILNLEPAPATEKEKIAAVETSSRAMHIAQFDGTVTDPIGSPIASAIIDVLKKGTEGKQRVTSLHTDAGGKFSADLPDGEYLIRIAAPGFEELLLLVNVSKSTNSEGLRLKLHIGKAT
jgi:hypothetical protein